MVFDVEEGLCRVSARNIKKYVLYFRTINPMEEVLYGKDQFKTGDQETKGNIFDECIRCQHVMVIGVFAYLASENGIIINLNRNLRTVSKKRDEVLNVPRYWC